MYPHPDKELRGDILVKQVVLAMVPECLKGEPVDLDTRLSALAEMSERRIPRYPEPEPDPISVVDRMRNFWLAFVWHFKGH